MSRTPTIEALEEERNAALEEWRHSLGSLLDDVARWSREAGWTVNSEEVHRSEELLGEYSASRLIVELPDGRVVLEPVARVVMGAQGRADLYGYPHLDRVMLLRKDGEWIVRPELGPTWPLPWNRETYLDLAERLSGVK